MAEALTEKQTELALNLRSADCIRYGNFTLRSGAASKIYVNLRPLRSMLDLQNEVVAEYARMIDELDYRPERVADIPVAISPIVTLLAQKTRIPQVTPRGTIKDYGINTPVEGAWDRDMTTLICDDVLTSGGSIIEKGLDPLKSVQLQVKDAFVLVDRCEQGARARLEALGIRVTAPFTLPQLEELYKDIPLKETAPPAPQQ